MPCKIISSPIFYLHLSLKLSFYNTYLSQILKTLEGEMTCCLNYHYCVFACVRVGETEIWNKGSLHYYVWKLSDQNCKTQWYRGCLLTELLPSVSCLMEKVTAESADFDQDGKSAICTSLALSFPLSLELHLCIWAFFQLFACLLLPSPCKPAGFFSVSAYSEKISATLCVTA